MRLLSIDVGIKNLAYCILDINMGKYTIVAWDVINLCGLPPKCNQQTKKGDCKRIAKYTKGKIMSCKSCAKNTAFIIPSANLLRAKQSRTKISDLRIIAKDYNIEVLQSDKKKNIQEKIACFMQESTLDLVSNTLASEMSLIDIGIALRNAFDTSLFLSVETVIIENQISPIANRMKTIQGMIAQFFIMSDIQDVHFVSAANKLKQYIDGKTTYKERKELGISTTLKIIHENEDTKNWESHFLMHSKKDDLADSFLQGLSFIDKHVEL